MQQRICASHAREKAEPDQTTMLPMLVQSLCHNGSVKVKRKKEQGLMEPLCCQHQPPQAVRQQRASACTVMAGCMRCGCHKWPPQYFRGCHECAATDPLSSSTSYETGASIFSHPAQKLEPRRRQGASQNPATGAPHAVAQPKRRPPPVMHQAGQVPQEHSPRHRPAVALCGHLHNPAQEVLIQHAPEPFRVAKVCQCS